MTTIEEIQEIVEKYNIPPEGEKELYLLFMEIYKRQMEATKEYIEDVLKDAKSVIEMVENDMETISKMENIEDIRKYMGGVEE